MPRRIAESVTSGVEVPYGIFDQKLGAYCEPWRTSDGKIRCVPSVREMPLIVYADAAHTKPVMRAAATAPPTAGELRTMRKLSAPFGSNASFASSAAFACSIVEVTDLARVGAKRAETTFYSGTTQGAVPPGEALYDLTLEPIDFVELQEARAQVAATMAARELHGSDGSQLFATDFYDTARRVPLEPRTDLPDGQARLLPPVARSEYRAAHFAPPVGGEATEQWCASADPIWNTWGCGQQAAIGPLFVSVGEQPPTTYAVVKQSGTVYTCSGGKGPGESPQTPLVVSSASGQSVYTACATIPLGDWPAVVAAPIGGGRLTTSMRSVLGVPIASPSDRERVFDDATLGAKCSPAMTTDGALRCVPIDTALVAYSDAACTERIAISPASTAPAFAKEGSETTFPSYVNGSIDVFAVGGAIQVAKVYMRTPWGCTDGLAWNAFAIGPSALSSLLAFEVRDAPP